jgi:hypothetical protein
MLIYVKGRYPQVVHIGEADVVDKLGIVSEMMFEIFLIFHSAMVVSQIILVIYLCRDICFSHILGISGVDLFKLVKLRIGLDMV